MGKKQKIIKLCNTDYRRPIINPSVRRPIRGEHHIKDEEGVKNVSP